MALALKTPSYLHRWYLDHQTITQGGPLAYHRAVYKILGISLDNYLPTNFELLVRKAVRRLQIE